MRKALRALAVVAFAGLTLLAGCEKPPPQTKQTGYRGTGMVQVKNPELAAYLKQVNAVPPPPYPLEPSDAPLAGQFYQNVQVLTDINADEFNRLMLSITEWVAPEQGCAYCHNTENMASDEHYTKVVARRMLQMTRTINGEWSSHVQKTGVTCYTCHRGHPVPQNTWTKDASMTGVTTIRNNKHGQNDPVASVAYSTLPKDPFTPYLLGAEPIRVQGKDSLATGHQASIAHTEKTYGLMMHMSQSLGVNCTFCHNSRHWQSWTESTPQRVTAWHGIRMARALNTEYIEPLKPVFPANRLGPLGDPLKVNCATCHQGVNKPLLGVSMLPDHPALAGRPAQSAMLNDPAAASVAPTDPAMAPATPDGATAAAPPSTPAPASAPPSTPAPASAPAATTPAPAPKAPSPPAATAAKPT